MNPMVSIIIPCYNTEQTLEETLLSVHLQDFKDWEAIIVNDGSPDKLEAIALNWVSKDNRFKYFKKDNGGLGSARNYGIEKSKGIYILPLDSDNKIRSFFVTKAVNILETNNSVGVVYGNAKRFGDINEFWEVGEFNKYKLLYHNYIDACSVIRKRVFDDLGLYDEEMPHQGHEDWEFWLRVVSSSHTFHYLNDITFDYRVSENSMIRNFDDVMLKQNIEYIQKKHHYLYCESYRGLFLNHIELIRDYNKLRSNYNKVKEELSTTFWFKLKKAIKKIFKK